MMVTMTTTAWTMAETVIKRVAGQRTRAAAPLRVRWPKSRGTVSNHLGYEAGGRRRIWPRLLVEFRVMQVGASFSDAGLRR
jgi:hypothetical protein